VPAVKLSYPGARDGYGDLGFSTGTDHLQNIVDLIYAARLQGAERLELSIDDAYAWNLALEHYYLFEHLPEAGVCRDAVDDVAVLHVRFEDARRACHTTAEQKLASMRDEDIDRMFAAIEREETHPNFGKISNSLLQDRFYTVQLPEWVLAKYKLLR
jgi:hypothetical protein